MPSKDIFYVQSDEPNRWHKAEPWQYRLISGKSGLDLNGATTDDTGRICHRGKYAYVYAYVLVVFDKNGEKLKSYGDDSNGIILNLDTGKLRLVKKNAKDDEDRHGGAEVIKSPHIDTIRDRIYGSITCKVCKKVIQFQDDGT